MVRHKKSELLAAILYRMAKNNGKNNDAKPEKQNYGRKTGVGVWVC